MQCPSRFLKQPSPKPVVPIKMAIIGPPKSGKTVCKCIKDKIAFFFTGQKLNYSLILLDCKYEKGQVTEKTKT